MEVLNVPMVDAFDVFMLNTIRKIHDILLFCGVSFLSIFILVRTSNHTFVRILEVIKLISLYILVAIKMNKITNIRYVTIWLIMYCVVVWFLVIILLKI